MIQVLERAFKILDFVAEEPENPKSLGAIAGHSALNPGTCANILKTLCEYNFLEQVDRKKGYILGPRVYYLARNGPYRKDIVRDSEPYVTRLASDVHETFLIATLHKGKRSILLQVEGDNVLNIKNEFLLQDNIYNTVTGRLLLAFLSQSELESFIAGRGLPDKNSWPEAVTAKKLRDSLQTIRKQGMVLRTTRKDVVGIAFPIKQHESVIAALGLFLPAYRFKGEHRKKVLEKMGETAEKISKAIAKRKQ